MENEKLLPKPQTDLPLPEKEIPAEAGLASKGVAFRSYRKYLVLGIVFVILLAIIGGAYFLGRNSVLKELNPTAPAIPSPDPVFYEPTPTPALDETADWKTYTNPQLGYSIKHPSNIVFKHDRFYLDGDDNRKDTADGFGPNLAIYSRSGTSPELAAQKELGKDVVLKEVSINNANGVQVDQSSLGFDYYLSSSDEKILRIIFSTQDYSPTVSKESIANMSQIATQILSTFRFE